MKIAILSRDENLYSCQRIRKEAEIRGHTVKVINPFFCYMKVYKSTTKIFYNEKILDYFDVVIPRISPSTTFYSIALLRHFELCGSYILNSSNSILQARDKFFSFQLLSKKNIDMPITHFSHYYNNCDLIKMLGGTPLIIKLIEGNQGIGVILAETQQTAESIIDTLRSLKVYFLVQEYIKEAKGSDIRCLVIGNKIIASIQRQAKKNDFRSNLHRGGNANKIDLTQQEKKIAIKAVKVLGLNLAGVDILRSLRGPLIMEINSSPGFEGLEYTTNKNISNIIIKWIENKIK